MSRVLSVHDGSALARLGSSSATRFQPVSPDPPRLTVNIIFQGCHDNDALDIAFSGAVASVAHVDGIHVHVACCGDVQAVLGSLEVFHLIDSEMPISALLSITTKSEIWL